MSCIALEPLRVGGTVAEMTFPAYRHLLEMRPRHRHDGDVTSPLVQAVGVVAHDAGGTIGLALADVPADGETHTATLLSVCVSPERRRQGIAARMLDALEAQLGALGVERIEAVYMTSRAGTAAVERLFASRGWSAPIPRTVTMKATLDQLQRMPWYGRVRLEARFDVFSWTELTTADKRALAESQLRQPWMIEGLEPWRHDHEGFDEVSSVGLRECGAVVGWVINHRLSAETVRFSGAFVRHDLSRRGKIFALYTESLERLRGTGCTGITCITPMRYASHVDFLRTRCAPWASFFAETRQCERQLAVAARHLGDEPRPQMARG